MSVKKEKKIEEIRKSEEELEKFGYKQELKRALSLPFLVFYGLAFVCLLTLFGTYGAISQASHGMTASSYVVSTVAMLFTALSYCFMSKAYPMSGSVYAYVGGSINKSLGFMSGWSILLDYMLVPMINYLLAATYIRVYFDIPVWAIVITLIVIVSIINHLGIEIAAWTNNIIVVVEIIFIVAFLIFMIKFVVGGGGEGTILSTTPFANPTESSGGIGGFGLLAPFIFAGAAITMANYSGFDAVSTMAEEANNSRNISKAIMITVVAISVYFVVISYFMTLCWPNGWQEFGSPDDAAWELVVKVAGSGMGVFFVATYIVATTASAIASQASAARVLYNMGRDGILPRKFFGYVNPKRKTPTGGIIAIAIVALSALFVPLTLSFLLLSFGALLGFIMVNASVVAHFFIKGKQRSIGGVIKYLLVPSAGAIICLISFISISSIGKIVGICWLAVGFICLAVSTKGFKKSPADLRL